MLHCPPSRINLTNTDVADFERRFAVKEEVARLAQVKATNIHLSAGPSHLARLTIVLADDKATRGKALCCSSKAIICNDIPGDGEGLDTLPLRHNLPPPLIQTSDYDIDKTVPRRTRNLPAERESIPWPSTGLRLQRRGGSTFSRRGRSSPPALDGVVERRLRPLTAQQTSRDPGPVNPGSRSSRQSSQRNDFVLYEDSAPVQAYNEAQHLHLGHARNQPTVRGRFLQLNPYAATRCTPSHPVLAVAGRPVLPPNLNPGAPAFIPRTRFGSGTGTSEENTTGDATVPQRTRQGSRVSSTQTTSNLRIRSSFERNSQQPYHRQDSRGSHSPNNITGIGPAAIQFRRGSHTSEHSSNLSAPSFVGGRYPTLRPLSSIPAPRRNNGAHRQVIFSQRRISQQQLFDNEGPIIPAPIRSSYDQRRSSTQSKSSRLFSPDVSDNLRASSAASSSNSRSTPNLFQVPSPAPLLPSRSSSASWDRYVSLQDSGYRVPSMVSAASGISGSSGGRTHRLARMPFEESMLSRGSPLDELLLDFSRLLSDDGRPRSAGRSFPRPPGSPSTESLLSGNIFQQGDTHEQYNTLVEGHNGSGRHPLKAANDTSFSEEDAVALSLALPSPNMPSSSPITATSPRAHAAIPTTATLISTPRSIAQQSDQSPSSLTQVQDATTPQVFVYDDSRSPHNQPQTPADINRSTHQARSRATTIPRQEVGVVGGGPFSPVIPERRPHRPYTYPAGTPPSMIGSAAMPGRSGIVGRLGVRQGVNLRSDQRGSGSSENDVEGSLAGLDADRRTWMERREEGSLEVTPPREGRFERYLR